MSNPILTPKKAFILVPGHGVIERADFTQEHARILVKHGESHGVDRDVFIKQHFNVSFGDLPLFEDSEQEKEVKPKAKKVKKEKTQEELDEEQLQKEIEAEEKTKE
jgi:2-succinyl-5-enolpyruvyl-6-hydroxy-3-cyclohexene-1-carboxylate synthase